jgi:hypothetical protein
MNGKRFTGPLETVFQQCNQHLLPGQTGITGFNFFKLYTIMAVALLPIKTKGVSIAAGPA